MDTEKFTMPYVVVLRSGKIFELDSEQWEKYVIKRKTTGALRPMHRVPGQGEFNMDMVEHVLIIEENMENVKPEVAKPTDVETPADEEVDEVIQDPKTQREQEEEIMRQIWAKSNCTHPEDQQQIAYKMTTVKGGGAIKRYFPTCKFCGQRFRYIKKDDLTEEQIENAVEWQEPV